ncbi:hypothetical protein Tco_1277004, partial [Tanacetum coccineum]
MSDTESDDTIQRKVSKKKATKKALVKKIDKKQADNKNKQKSTESESDSDFAVGTFVKYNEVELKKKGKRPTVQKDSDCEDAVCTKKKRKGNKREDNMIVACQQEAEAKVVEVKTKTNDRKAINARMSPRNLKRDLNCDALGVELLWPRMHEDVNSILGLWVVKSFNPKTCTVVMEDGSMIKITRELIHDMLGILMGDIKVKSLKEKNLLDPVTAKRRGMMPEIFNHEKKINISQLETFLCTLSEADWLFDIGFLLLFFSIFGQGNKDGTINERLIPYLDETDKIHQMDWCSYVLESLVKECTIFSASDKFNGSLLLLA